MPVFEYKALEANGAPAHGKLEAGGRQDAMRLLEGKGLTPIRVTEADGAPKAAGPLATSSAKPGKPAAMPWQSKGVSFAALEDFTRSLSSLLAANVPLSRALTILYKETSQPAASEKWRELHDYVIDGMPLAEAMGRSPEVFPRVYVAMVESGETGGFLDVVLAQIADFQAREKELRAKVGAALMYPLVLLFLALSVSIFLLIFFIPKFQKLFEDFDAPLPMLTRAIIGVSTIARHYGIYIALAIGAAIYFSRHWFTQESSRRTWESWLLRSPIIGPLASKLAMARFCRMLGTLLNAGVSLISRALRRTPLARLPDVDRPRRGFHRAREKRPAARRQPCGLPAALWRLDARNARRGRGKRSPGPGIDPDRRRHGNRSRSKFENRRFTRGADDALSHRRFHWHDISSEW